MTNLFIGIDNGVDGGIVVIGGSGKIVSKQVTPTIKVKKGKTNRTDFDLDGMRALVIEFGRIHGKNRRGEPDGENVLVVLEKGQPFPPKMTSAAANFSCGYCYGLWLAFLCAFNVPHVVVPAKQWQHRMLQGVSGTTKQKSISKAKKRHPNVDWRKSAKSKNPHDGITDAYWMAEYGRKYES